jgi:hypothetical protein
MSKEPTKPTDPLLGGEGETDENQVATQTPPPPATTTPPAPATTAAIPPVKKSPLAKIKAEAVAKFPKDVIAQTKYILTNSEQVSFIIPKIEGEVGEETVQINGYRLTIQKGAMVSVPIQVANLLAEKYKIALSAGSKYKADRAADVSQALG